MHDTDVIVRCLHEIEEMREELSFVVRTLSLADKGHATVAEYGRLREIAERYERSSARRAARPD